MQDQITTYEIDSPVVVTDCNRSKKMAWYIITSRLQFGIQNDN